MMPTQIPRTWLFCTVLLSSVFLISCSQKQTAKEDASSSVSYSDISTSSSGLSEEDYFACDSNIFPFKEGPYASHGQFSWEGRIITRRENVAWDGPEDWQTLVYMSVKNDGEKPFFYFKGKVDEGNAINDMQGADLLFKLGALNEDNLLSTAEMSQETENKIMLGLNAQTPVRLEFTIPIYPGGGAPHHFSYACKIQ